MCKKFLDFIDENVLYVNSRIVRAILFARVQATIIL